VGKPGSGKPAAAKDTKSPMPKKGR
jgi:hypothetical protein